MSMPPDQIVNLAASLLTLTEAGAKFIDWFRNRKRDTLLSLFKRSLKEVQEVHRKKVEGYIDVEITDELLAKLFAVALSRHRPEEIFPREKDIKAERYLRAVAQTMVEHLSEELHPLEDENSEILVEALQKTFEKFLWMVFRDLGPEARFEVYKIIEKTSSANTILLIKILEKISKELPRFRESRIVEEELGIYPIRVSEPEFFRKFGPLWIDFKKGYVVEREEIVKQIIDGFKNGIRFQMLVGGAASGKSVIARNVEYRIFKENEEIRTEYIEESPWEIFVIHASNFNDYLIGKIMEDIDKIEDDEKGRILLVLEDIHHDPWRANQILQIAEKKANLNLLLTARPEYEQYKAMFSKGGGGQKDTLEECKKILLNLEGIPQRVIERYEKKRSEELEQEWRIKAQDLPLLREKGRASLWLLSYYLEAYDPEKGFKEESVYEKIKGDIEVIGKKYGREGKDVILALAPLSRYEIPAQESLLTYHEGLGYDYNTLEVLLNAGEIGRSKEGETICYSLPHSEIARIYLETAQRKPWLISSIKDRLNTVDERLGQEDQNLETDILTLYLKTRPKNALTVIDSIPVNYLQKILENKQTQDSIIQGIKNAIDQTQDLLDVERCLSSMVKANPEVAEELVPNVAKKIDKTDDLWLFEWFFYSAADTSPEISEKLAEAINIETLIEKVEQIKDLKFLGRILSSVAIANTKVAEKLVPSIAKKIDKTEDLLNAGECLAIVANNSPEIGKKLGGAINIENIETLVRKIEQIKKMNWVVEVIFFSIARANSEVAEKLVPYVAKRIDQMKSLWNIGEFFCNIPENSPKLVEKLIKAINIETLAKKIEKAENLLGIGLCLSVVARASPEMAENLIKAINIEILAKNIEKAKSLDGVDMFLSGVASVSSDLAENLIQIIAKKIDRTEDVRGVCICFSLVAEKGDIGCKLARAINTEILARKIERTEDVEAAGLCLSCVALGDSRVAEELVISVARRINRSRDMNAIRLCLDRTSDSGPYIRKRLAQSLDLKALSRKINAANYRKYVEDCFEEILDMSIDVAEKLCEMITVYEYRELFGEMLIWKRREQMEDSS